MSEATIPGFIAINPGSGDVANATEESALANIRQFVADLKREGVTIERNASEDRGGRFGFTLSGGDKVHEVRMPGLPLDRVRYMRETGQNIWHFPRLYVDGSSWVWFFALNVTFQEEEAD